MKFLPSFLQGQSGTRLLQGAAFGALATLAIGFNWFGIPGADWYTNGGAKKFAREVASAKVQEAQISLLAPACAAQFNALPDAAAKRALLAAASDSYEQRKHIPEAWVSLPGNNYADSNLVTACTGLILKKGAAAKS